MSEPRMESEDAFRVPSQYTKCRGGGRTPCPKPPIADMARSHHEYSTGKGRQIRWWAYCAGHLLDYHREVRDGRVWRLSTDEVKLRRGERS